jgi:hypothetical protein
MAAGLDSSGQVISGKASAVRFRDWFLLVLGVACLAAAGTLGILAIQQAAEISAYHHARACPAGASPHADCLQAVDGVVAGVTEFPGGYRVSPDYELGVRTASTTLHLTFSSDSPMLGYAADGDPAVVTMWRGVPVAVVTDGRSAVTTSVPETALARDLGKSEEFGGVGVFLVIGALAIRRKRRAGGATVQLARPALAAALLALVLGGLVVVLGGIALGGKPSRIGPDLAGTGAAIVVIVGLSAWLGIRARRRVSGSPAGLGRGLDMARVAYSSPTPVPPAAALRPVAKARLLARAHPANWARALARYAAFLPVLLTVGVLFGVMFTSQDGPPARAFRQAPACRGETNLATCAGDFTAVINGVRAPANDADFADVSYATPDGAINTWASFDGNAVAIAGMAAAEEKARTPLRIEVWRRSIIGAELGGSWHWAQGDPPGDMIPAVFLAVSFALLLLMVRLRNHLRPGAGASRRRLFLDDLGQVAAAAGSVVLLAFGFWPGAVLALAALLWLGLSARRSTRRKLVRHA